MALTIGDEAPNFTAQTTEGEIDFHDWSGDSSPWSKLPTRAASDFVMDTPC